MKVRIEGVIPVPPTFYKHDMSLDEESIRSHIDFLLEKGVHGIWAVGSVSEFPLLSISERKKVAEIIIDQTNNRVPVYVCVSHVSTDKVIELAKHAKDIGADAVSATPPYYYVKSVGKPEVLYEHFKVIASTIDIPLVIYNFPAGTGVDIPPNLIAKLSEEFSNIIGLKDTTDSLTHMVEVLRLTKGRIYVVAGTEDFLLPLILAGGHGAVSGLASAFPELPVEIYKKLKEGDYRRAEELHRKIIALRAITKVGLTPITFIKEALRIRGLPVNTYVRKPLLSLTDEERNRIRKIISEVLGEEYLSS